MYEQVLDPLAASLGISSLAAALPLVVLFVLLGVLRMTAWKASLIALAVAIVVAVVVYPMPLGQALLATTEGATFGFFPILFIVINALWIYNMTVETGHFEVLQRTFAKVSDDQRIQAVIIAFCFGALLEALAGFGTPVAITSVMLIALGVAPMRAAVIALVANTAPVAFGALASPITALSTVTEIPEDVLGAMTGRQTPVLALFVPMVLVFILSGWRSVRETLPATVLCGVTFAIAQFLASNYLSVPLTDIVAALAAAGAVVVLVRFWTPPRYEPRTDPADEADTAPSGGAGSTATTTSKTRTSPVLPDTGTEVLRAYAPYLIIIGVFVVAQLGPIAAALDAAVLEFQWPGLDVRTPDGEQLGLTTFTFDSLGAAGSLLLVAGLLTIPALRIRPGRALARYGTTYVQLRFAILTVMAVLALAYVMNTSGQTATLGNWMAGAGGLFALLSPVLGWLGVAVTGSDTSSNTLFGGLQITAAEQAGIDPTLAAAANGSGGVLGKMISPQNLAIAAGAVGLTGREGDIFRRVFGWSIAFLVLMSALVYLQSTPVLSWMVVS